MIYTCKETGRTFPSQLSYQRHLHALERRRQADSKIEDQIQAIHDQTKWEEEQVRIDTYYAKKQELESEYFAIKANHEAEREERLSELYDEQLINTQKEIDNLQSLLDHATNKLSVIKAERNRTDNEMKRQQAKEVDFNALDLEIDRQLKEIAKKLDLTIFNREVI